MSHATSYTLYSSTYFLLTNSTTLQQKLVGRFQIESNHSHYCIYYNQNFVARFQMNQTTPTHSQLTIV